MKLRRSLAPLYFTSKILCINPFSRYPLKASPLGSLLTACGAIGYAIFHLWLANIDMSESNDTDNVEHGEHKNLVAIIIDSYNRYSGFCVLCVIIITSIAVQPKIVKAILILEEVDGIFGQKFGIEVENYAWSRNVSMQILIFICSVVIFEWRNCLMYIQASIPFSEYCIIMCLAPMFVTGITEIQFIAYLQLIRNRLKLLNTVLTDYRNKNSTIEVRKNHDILRDPKEINTKSKLTKYTRKAEHRHRHHHAQTHFILNDYSAYVNKGVSQSMLQFPNKKKHENTTNSTAIRIDCNAYNKHPKGIISRFTNLLKALIEKQKILPIVIENEALDKFRLNDFTTQNVIEVQKIYTKLERVSIVLSSSYGVHLIVILIIKFTTLTSLLYFCCMIIIKLTSGVGLDSENKDQLLSSTAWIGTFLIEIFLLCLACSLTKSESKKIGYNLHRFARMCDNTQCKIRIKAFSMQLLHDRIEFRPLGLFQLDLGFMYGLIGSVCTYLIILIQFDLAQKSQNLTAANSNTTITL